VESCRALDLSVICYSALLCVVTQTHRWLTAVISVQWYE